MAEADTFPAGVGGAGAGAGRSGGGGAREGPKAGARSVDKCSACWSGEVMEDPWLGAAVCQQCGHVAADSMLQEHLSFVGSGSQPLGTMVTDAEVAEGFWSDRRAGGQDEAEEEAKGTVERLPAHRQTAKFDALSGLRRMCRMLQVPRHVERSAKGVLEEAVSGGWGTGDWMDAASAACLYIAVRRARLPLSMVEVADVAGLQPHQTWLVYNRVLSVLADKAVPPVEPALFILRAVAGIPAFATWQGKEGQRKLVADCGAILSFAANQGLLTGRHPLGVAAACILTAARAHRVAVTVEDVCRAVHAVPSTALSRFKELWSCLASFACSLPWGAGVEEKSLSRHLPFLLTVLRESKGGKDDAASTKEKQGLGHTLSAAEMPAPFRHSIEAILPANEPGPAPPAYQAAVAKDAQKKRNLAVARQRLKESRKRWKGEAADVHATGDMLAGDQPTS